MKTPSHLIRPLSALAALAAIALSASACGTTTANEERGRALFIEKCGTCHVLAQAGTSGQTGPDLDAAFAAAREVGATDATVEGIVKPQIENPRPMNDDPMVSMPAEIVTGQDLEDVAAYVGKWAGVPGAEPPKVEGGPGAQVFANNGCGGCHTLAAAGSGGVAGPDLDEVLVSGDTEAAIEKMIVDPDAEIAPGFAAGVMPDNFEELLSAKELHDLVQFLYESTPAGSGNAGGKGSGR